MCKTHLLPLMAAGSVLNFPPGLVGFLAAAFPPGEAVVVASEGEDRRPTEEAEAADASLPGNWPPRMLLGSTENLCPKSCCGDNSPGAALVSASSSS